ncbi:sugar ABC transporter ATP-binding protein [Candidatus Sumerlaeota bacterium]|nr:sugar ABC transporter ATP-binding protein [Candidatus Sumerlaeota bacterium]
MSTLVEINNIDKRFGGVHALKAVTFTIDTGEIHSLCGENGAGKSTLIKILCGAYIPNEGSITIDGRELPYGNVPGVGQLGVAVIHQESTAFLDLNAIDNVFIGRELRTSWGALNRKAMARETRELLARLQESLDIYKPLSQMTVAQRQMVTMARALAQKCKLLIMDEPTASLSKRETDVLFDNIARLKAGGVSILYVSHRMEEIFQLSDRVTVFRDGEHVGTEPIGNVDTQKVIQMMVGREVAEFTKRHEHKAHQGATALALDNLTSRPAFENISFEVKAGEIVGMAGLVGSGRSEIARAVFGIDNYQSGVIRVLGKAQRKGNVRDAMAAGIAMVPEDRQHEGLLLPLTVSANISMAVLQNLLCGPFLSKKKEGALAQEYIEELSIRTGSAHAVTSTLSGGNQQKVVIGKWLATQPRILILDEPTRGVDVGAKAEMYRIIRELAEKGVAIWVISSDMPEILHISDRILVMCEGRLKGELEGKSATQEDVMRLALPDLSEEGAILA